MAKFSSTHRTANRFAAFRKDDEGSLTIFSVYLFILMIMIGGLAVDIMRYEIVRTRLENTLDRAILAAADLDQRLTPADVVQDYFDKNGMSQFVNASVTTGGLNFRTVSADASATMPTMFKTFIGIDELSTQLVSTATESVEDIEISLVLDISGSMGWNNKLQEMQEAAIDFVDIIYSQGEYEDISISIIPYSTQVNVGLNLMNEFRVTWHHDESTCIDFEDNHFDEPSIRTDRQYTQSAHFDPWYAWGPMSTSTDRLMVCRDDRQSEILPFANMESALETHINGLTAGGNTSIEIGVKWGAALLHHDAQPAISALVADNVIDNSFSGRPYTRDSGASLKIMVVMTDGVNTDEFRLMDHIRTGWSSARVDPETGHFYILSNENGDRDGDNDWNEPWFVPHLFHAGYNSFWRDSNDGVHDPEGIGVDDWFAGVDDDDDLDGVMWDDDVDIDDSNYDPNSYSISRRTIKLKYDELYDRVSLRYHAWYHMYAQYWDADMFYDWVDDITWIVPAWKKDTNMSDICAKARAYDITIYSVGFEVTDESALVMADCASTPSHFYRVAGPEIGDAFRSIARQVNELRLIR